ncbi:hypothetical protein E5288_WYG008619 [Bos mutus]|uniref:Uncharacterized protein n=1 Tax=Bos mutus TaxID=72004 RepID=A0A6B0SDB8_9CETA|nr:hypothetical protein [Bos mutus]
MAEIELKATELHSYPCNGIENLTVPSEVAKQLIKCSLVPTWNQLPIESKPPDYQDLLACSVRGSSTSGAPTPPHRLGSQHHRRVSEKRGIFSPYFPQFQCARILVTRAQIGRETKEDVEGGRHKRKRREIPEDDLFEHSCIVNFCSLEINLLYGMAASPQLGTSLQISNSTHGHMAIGQHREAHKVTPVHALPKIDNEQWKEFQRQSAFYICFYIPPDLFGTPSCPNYKVRHKYTSFNNTEYYKEEQILPEQRKGEKKEQIEEAEKFNENRENRKVLEKFP